MAARAAARRSPSSRPPRSATGTPQELRHARRRHRQVGGLVALASPRLRRQVRAVGLDTSRSSGRARTTSREPPRARIRHRARRSRSGARGRGRAAPPRGRPRSSGGSRRRRRSPRSAQTSRRSACASRQWSSTGFPTARASRAAPRARARWTSPRREVPEVVEPDLADRHDARRPGERRDPRERRRVRRRWRRAGGSRRPRRRRAPRRRARWRASEVGTSVPMVRKPATPAARARASTTARSSSNAGSWRCAWVSTSPVTRPPGSAGGRSAGRRPSARPRSSGRPRRREVGLPRVRAEAAWPAAVHRRGEPDRRDHAALVPPPVLDRLAGARRARPPA